MQELTQILAKATASVRQEYFLLPIDGSDSIYRERVYCYELYHQMRRLWPDNSHLRLNGEVDKTAHPYFQAGRQRPKPDLLVHQPGSGQYNHAVIEVKASTASRKGIKKDLETLSLFRASLRYDRAIYLVYGNEAEETLVQVLSCAGKMEGLRPIEVWLNPIVASPAEPKRILGLGSEEECYRLALLLDEAGAISRPT